MNGLTRPASFVMTVCFVVFAPNIGVPDIGVPDIGAPNVGAKASELVYRPINPNFGGNPFNSDILLGTANAQNKYEEEREEQTVEEQFVRTLQGRLLSGLASQVTDAIFGDEAQESGSFTVGDQTVNFVRGLETIQIEILNGSDGTSTSIEVPTVASLE